MKDIIDFIESFDYDAQDMIDFATWWQSIPKHPMQPGPASPDLKDWIDIYKTEVYE